MCSVRDEKGIKGNRNDDTQNLTDKLKKRVSKYVYTFFSLPSLAFTTNLDISPTSGTRLSCISGEYFLLLENPETQMHILCIYGLKA